MTMSVQLEMPALSRPVAFAAGLLAAGAVAAVAHLSGVDPRALYSGESRLVPGLLAILSQPSRAPDA